MCNSGRVSITGLAIGSVLALLAGATGAWAAPGATDAGPVRSLPNGGADMEFLLASGPSGKIPPGVLGGGGRVPGTTGGRPAGLPPGAIRLPGVGTRPGGLAAPSGAPVLTRPARAPVAAPTGGLAPPTRAAPVAAPAGAQPRYDVVPTIGGPAPAQPQPRIPTAAIPNLFPAPPAARPATPQLRRGHNQFLPSASATTQPRYDVVPPQVPVSRPAAAQPFVPARGHNQFQPAAPVLAPGRQPLAGLPVRGARPLSSAPAPRAPSLVRRGNTDRTYDQPGDTFGGTTAGVPGPATPPGSPRLQRRQTRDQANNAAAKRLAEGGRIREITGPDGRVRFYDQSGQRVAVNANLSTVAIPNRPGIAPWRLARPNDPAFRQLVANGMIRQVGSAQGTRLFDPQGYRVHVYSDGSVKRVSSQPEIAPSTAVASTSRQ